MIPHNRPTLGLEEKAAAIRVLESGWLAAHREVTEFENEFCGLMGLPEKHAVFVSSGTAALFLALWVLGAKGKKIGYPAYVCSSLRHATRMAGGEEILLDTAPEGPNLDLSEAAESSCDILIAPHLYGIPMDLEALQLPIIEDCAQALGAKVRNNLVGLQGKLGIFSFYASKLMTSGGQGGMIVSRDLNLVDAVRDFVHFDCKMDSQTRFNFLPTELAAAIGREQLKKLPSFLTRRKEIFETYQEAGLPLLAPPSNKMADLKPVHYRAILKTSQPQEIIQHLSLRGVRTIVPIETGEILGPPTRFPRAFELSTSTVSLPIYPTLTQSEVQMIIKEICPFLESQDILHVTLSSHK